MNPRPPDHRTDPGRFRVLLLLPGLLFCPPLPPGASLVAQVLQTDLVASHRLPDSAAFGGVVRFDLSVEQQRNTVVTLGAGADLRANAGPDAVLLAAQAKRTYAGDLRVSNSGFGHLRYRMARAARAGAEFFTQAQWDGPRGMKHRFLLGGNLRYTIQRDSAGSLDAAAGVMYEGERWGYDGVEPADRPADPPIVVLGHARINTYLRFERRLAPGVGLLLMNYLQARPDGGLHEPRIASSARLTVEITSSLAFTAAFNSIYDFAPVVPIRNFYFDLTNGLAVRF